MQAGNREAAFPAGFGLGRQRLEFRVDHYDPGVRVILGLGDQPGADPVDPQAPALQAPGRGDARAADVDQGILHVVREAGDLRICWNGFRKPSTATTWPARKPASPATSLGSSTLTLGGASLSFTGIDT